MNLRRSFILALVVTSGGSALAGTADNPYTPIVTRNMFGLVPVPPVDSTSLVSDKPLPKITPNGTMTLFGKLQVLFKVTDVPVPGQPPKDNFKVMGEGEREDEITVQKIDEKAGTITFDNHGTIQELALVAGKASGGAPAAAAPGIPMPSPMPPPGVASAAGGANPAIGFGGRFGRTRPAPGTGTPGVSGGGGAPVFGGGPGSGAAPAANTATTEPLSPEAQVIMMEAQRAQFKAAGNPAAAIIPPTPITDQLNDDGGGPPMPGQ